MSNNSQIGNKYGRWTINGDARKRYFLCTCKCGTVREVYKPSVLRGMSRSCGCLAIEEARKRQTVHGCAIHDAETPEYKSWMRMRHRCNSPTATQYRHYGGRGIKICQRWDDFLLFLNDVGPSPGAGYSLERKDNDGNYEPGNVRWATMKEQANNRRTTVLLSLNGETMSVSMWADRIGISAKALYARRVMGWSDDQIIMRPRRKMKHSKTSYRIYVSQQSNR